MSLTGYLADFVDSLTYNDIPGEAKKNARIAILDFTGVAIAGSHSPQAEIVIRHIQERGEQPAAGLLGREMRTSACSAALANGVFGHALEFDDSNLSMDGHPSAPVLPAVFALGEQEGLSGAEIITAYIAGFETEAKLGRATALDLCERGWHTTSILGIFGAAAASCRLLKLPGSQIRTAFGIASSMASGTKKNFGTMAKSLHCGMAAQNGITAARLAQNGFSAAEDVFDTGSGFLKMLGIPDRDISGPITGTLGNPFDIVSPGVMLKPYPCCGNIFTSMQALEDIVSSNSIQHKDIEKIESDVSCLVMESLCKKQPENALEARFSLECCLGTLLLEGGLALSHFSDSWLHSRALEQIMRKISCSIHPEMDSRDKLSDEFAEVTVILKGGSKYKKRVYKSKRKGGIEHPLSQDEVLAKYRQCAQDVIGRSSTEKSIQSFMDLENVGNIQDVMGLLCA